MTLSLVIRIYFTTKVHSQDETKIKEQLEKAHRLMRDSAISEQHIGSTLSILSLMQFLRSRVHLVRY
jgi:hypothetical protein